MEGASGSTGQSLLFVFTVSLRSILPLPSRSQRGLDLAGPVPRAVRWIRAGQQVTGPGERRTLAVGCSSRPRSATVMLWCPQNPSLLPVCMISAPAVLGPQPMPVSAMPWRPMPVIAAKLGRHLPGGAPRSVVRGQCLMLWEGRGC